MSAYNSGERLCRPDGNGCVCGECIHRSAPFKDKPEGCYGPGCTDCDPDRTELDDGEDYGPVKKCDFFEREK